MIAQETILIVSSFILSNWHYKASRKPQHDSTIILLVELPCECHDSKGMHVSPFKLREFLQKSRIYSFAKESNELSLQPVLYVPTSVSRTSKSDETSHDEMTNSL